MITSVRARRVVLAAIATVAIGILPLTPVAAAAGGDAAGSCSGLQHAISNAAHSVGPLTQFVDHGCQPPAPPPFTAPSACANWETRPLPDWCYPPPLPMALAGGNYDSYPIGGGAAQAFVLTNQTTSSFDVAGVVIGGPDASNFVLRSDQCSGTSLAAGATCSLTVVFTATAARAFSATLAVSSATLGRVIYSQLSGDGPVAPMSFFMTTARPNTFDYHYDFLPPAMTGDVSNYPTVTYTFTPSYSFVDVTTADANGRPYHGAMTAAVTSDDCPYQVQGGSSYTFSSADAGVHRFLASLGDGPTFTAVCTLRVHDVSGAIADGTAPGHVVGELCNDTDDNGNGAADELFPQVAVTATAPDGTQNTNPHPATSVTVGSGAQQRTGTWACSADRQRVVPMSVGGIAL